VKLLLITLIVFYIIIAAHFFTTWLKFLEQELRTYSSEDRYLSWVTLIVATILWPVVVPISYLELLKAKNPRL